VAKAKQNKPHSKENQDETGQGNISMVYWQCFNIVYHQQQQSPVRDKVCCCDIYRIQFN